MNHSEETIARALTALTANNGYVKPTAEAIGVPRKTLEHWAKGTRRAPKTEAQAAKRAELGQLNADEIVKGLNMIIPAGVERVLEGMPTLNAYQAMLATAIAIDKKQLLEGRATSRTESHTFRYVEPDALRKLAANVVDVTPVAHLTDPQVSALPLGNAHKRGRKRSTPTTNE